MIQILVLTGLLLVVLIIMSIRLKRQVVQQRQLREDAEESRRQMITEQKRNQQLKQEMTSNIAHELKTPVSSIRGYLEILLGDKPVDEQQRQYFLERCYTQTLRLSELIADVALINKLEEANDLFIKEPVNVSDCADEAIEELSHSISQHNMTIENNLPPSIIINGDRFLLYTIFRNTIENSTMHAGDGCKIVLDCYKDFDGTFYYLRVFDTGVGVGNEYLPKLFDRFLRIDEGRSRKNGGSGLGLSIVKHAVQLHGGEVYAKNRQEGGLEILFSLRKE